MRKLLTISAILSIVFFAGCKKDTYVPVVTKCPVVISTTPQNGAFSVPLNQVITATFNEKMNASSIIDPAFTLTNGQTTVAGIVSYTDSTASFTPTGGFLPNTTYIARITTAAKDLYGNHVQTDYVWTFSTGATVVPTVISTNPVNNAINVPLTQKVNATFSLPMDPTTISSASFILKQGLTPVTGTVSYTGTTATFTPTANLITGAIYTATITTGAKDIAGASIPANYVWTFSTGASIIPTVVSTDPANNATGIPLNKIVSATFSIPMASSTITAATYTLKQGVTMVLGTVSYAGSTASFSPSANLLPGLVYTATITTGAQDPAGAALANNYVWTFTTGTSIAPTVISTDPANNASGVALNKIIGATFSTAMSPASISTSTFTLKQGSTPVSGAVTYAGTTASFTPATNLISGTTYTATITTGARDIAGDSLSNNYVWTFTTTGALGPLPIDLRSVASFGIMAGVGVSNNAGPSKVINLNVGISPGVRSSITGFPPATIVNGTMYASDDISPPGVAAMLTQAKLDLTNAYLAAESASNPAPVTVSGDQGGLTLTPGIYKSTSTLMIQSGNLTLDARGDVNAVWIFQIASGFTTIGGAGGSVILIGGAQAGNVFWQTGTSATIGNNTAFQGNILALTSITMDPFSTAVGRMLAINASVVMTSTNTITKP